MPLVWFYKEIVKPFIYYGFALSLEALCVFSIGVMIHVLCMYVHLKTPVPSVASAFWFSFDAFKI